MTLRITEEIDFSTWSKAELANEIMRLQNENDKLSKQKGFLISCINSGEQLEYNWEEKLLSKD